MYRMTKKGSKIFCTIIYLGHILVLKWGFRGSAEGVCTLSGSLCETEAVVKLRPTQSRRRRAPNNDLNVTTDDTSGVRKQEPKSICSSTLLEENGLKGERKEEKKRKEWGVGGRGSEGGLRGRTQHISFLIKSQFLQFFLTWWLF